MDFSIWSKRQGYILLGVQRLRIRFFYHICNLKFNLEKYMPRLSKQFKDAVRQIPTDELQKLVIELEMVMLRGRGPVQKRIAASMAWCVKEINHFAKVTKNKQREADLLQFLIQKTFDSYEDELGTCWTVFDSKLAVTTKRFYTLTTKNLHKDLFMDYRDALNRFLSLLHKNCNHLDFVFDMPNEV